MGPSRDLPERSKSYSFDDCGSLHRPMEVPKNMATGFPKIPSLHAKRLTKHYGTIRFVRIVIGRSLSPGNVFAGRFRDKRANQEFFLLTGTVPGPSKRD